MFLSTMLQPTLLVLLNGSHPVGIDAILNTVLHGSFYTTLEVGKHWIAQGRGGSMLNMVTVYAEKGSAFVVPSSAAKAGVLALTRSLSVEWAKYGIRQVAIALGSFPTEGAWDRLAPTPELSKGMINRIPVGRFGEKQELCDLAAFLISDNAGFINGEVITIDGGEWLKGAGVFNDLVDLSKEEWDEINELTRSAK
jgi:NAD(P)-dependent dehydrogenase (short-subunit alcohol dehydrogenase family)